MPVLYNPLDPRMRIDPYPFYRQLRELDPVQLMPDLDTWILTRHADCLTVLRDPRFSSREAHRLRQRAAGLAPSMLNSDPPEHGRLRAAVATAWNATSVSAACSRIEALVVDLARTLEGRPVFDLIGDYANPLAAGALAAVLGLPVEDRPRLQRWLDESSGNVDPMAPPQAQRKGSAAAARLRHYFSVLTEERRAAPTGDVLSSLATTAGLGPDELLETCNLFVIGGYEPLANLIGNGMLALLQHPEQLAQLRSNPELVGSAVNELLRFDSPIPFVARIAREDVAVGGRHVRRGQSVIPLLAAANRDPAVFDRPDELDIRRSPNPHLSFGAGPHACFGALFTKMVAPIAFTAIVPRFPALRLATPSPEWRSSVVPRGLKTLPVAGSPGSGQESHE
jgi:cytochrome P450